MNVMNPLMHIGTYSDGVPPVWVFIISGNSHTYTNILKLVLNIHFKHVR